MLRINLFLWRAYNAQSWKLEAMVIFFGYLQAAPTKLESNTNSIISVYFYDSGVSGNYR